MEEKEEREEEKWESSGLLWLGSEWQLPLLGIFLSSVLEIESYVIEKEEGTL